MYKHTIYLLALVALIGCNNELEKQQSGTNIIDDVSISTTLSNQRISSIAQDGNGYIWFGTYRGLNRFNGHEMHQYFCNDEPNSIPDNQIRSLFTDRNGRLWLSTKNGIARHTDMDDFEQIKANSTNLFTLQLFDNSRGEIFALQASDILRYDSISNEFNIVIRNIENTDYVNVTAAVDSEDMIWVVSKHKVACYSSNSLQKREVMDFSLDPINTSLLVDDKLWLATDRSIMIYDVLAHKWLPTPEAIAHSPKLNNTFINCLSPLKDNGVLIGTMDCLYLFDKTTGTLISEKDSGFPFATPDFYVNFSFCDKDDNIWLCSSSRGFCVRANESQVFNSNSYLRSTLSNITVASVATDNKGNLWVASPTNGLYYYEPSTNDIEHYDLAKLIPGIGNQRVSAHYVFSDSRGDVWVGSYPGGVLQLRPEGKSLHLVKRYDINMAIVIKEDSNGTIWVGCYNNSFFSKRVADNHFQTHHIIGTDFSYMSCLRLLNNGQFAALIKEQGLRYINQTTLDLMPQVIPDSAIASCVERNVFLPSSLLEDSHGNLWIGTVSNGIMRYDTSTGQLSPVKGRITSDICSLEEDGNGNIWASTLYGLAKYNTKTNSFITFYKSDGIGGNEFYDRASCKLPDGTLVFGGTHGLTVFNPMELTDEVDANLYFEDLKIYNKIVRPYATENISKALAKSDKIELEYNQNSFSISFSNLDYGDNERFSFQYMLEGLDKQWIDAHNNREAFYSNLKSGNYIFRVRLLTKDQTRVAAQIAIPVELSPAPWATWWARTIYALLFVLTVTIIARLYARLHIERWTRIESEREREHEKRINRMNMSFFANVSHEFRTPLTIISGPVSQLVNDASVSAEHHRLLVIAQHSIVRMLRLVNQMMDFHKLEDDALRLEVRRQDIITLLKQSVEIFNVQAHEKKQTISTYGIEDNYLLWMDADKIDKITCNLLGNAVKYTPAGGHIDVKFDVINRQQAASEFPLTSEDKETVYVKVSVIDNGDGIPSEELNKIFERYYQLRKQARGQFNWGTGIGLYYAKRLVTMHHGYIKAENNRTSSGAVFSFIIPASESSYSDAERTVASMSQTTLYPIESSVEYAEEEDGSSDDKQTILVVDDDVEIVHYVKTLLSPCYNVVCRFDADSALVVIRENAPDLVLCDVMMPGRTGFDFCNEVKNDLQISHIPVILVTAKTTTSDQVMGLDSGADAYVTKPFDPSYLTALISNILQNRAKVRQLLGENTQTETIDEDVLSPQDTTFMTELYKIMEQELANPDLDVTHMTDLLHISRTKLYYKVKGLTGENPSIFFKRYKLNRAAELLKEGKYNISEIADMTGFSSLSHFSTSFKKQFGLTPSEYK